ncbi:hypothetical protein JQ594_34370 [Bradyrhizobium manausense]|uniref:hypothetical protein n=1 Tax=Bradyrhizobium manausense TaxID=989370 RepID=UPI001BAD805B|nr:hypothetical protein [Bradyrhizobium manausense]MBR0691041.1 hypothetical protein [Bradyrhizobium manausense]MBR0726094.1 hypothetical protein [Bradyrhizobium manausense]
MANRNNMESPLRDIAAISRRFTTWLLEIVGWEQGHRIRLSGGLSLNIAKHWAELQTAGEGPQYRLSRGDAALFVRHVLNVLAARERRKIVVSHELCVVVDARTERIPETLLQKLGYRFIRPEQVILSFGCDTFRYWANPNRRKVEAGLKEADEILGDAPPAVHRT